MKIRFQGSAPSMAQPGPATETTSNFFLGKDPAKWQRGVKNFTSIRYQQIYPGVDAVFYGNGSQMEYDLVIAPGADPKKIRMSITGAQGLHLESDGTLVAKTAKGRFVQHPPNVYQERSGRKVPVDCRYVLKGNIVSLHLGEYDDSAALTVDPILTYATYIGGARTDVAARMAVDNAGNVYLFGDTFSTNFPASQGIFATSNAGGRDSYVAKFNSRGALVYSTYIGGNDGELAAGIAVDAAGNAYIAGTTASTNFPTVNPYQSANKGGYSGLDTFVAKLNPSGTNLVYSTYLGGNDDEFASGIAVDSVGSVYVTGATFSLNFPLSPGAFQSSTPGFPAFVTKLNPAGSALIYSTLVGGIKSDIPGAIAVDASGSAYVVGDTSSPDFPITPGAFQTSNRGGTSSKTDAYVFKLNPTGTGLLFSTFLGGTGDESGLGLSLDTAGNAYVVGKTASTDFPTTTGAVQRALGGPTDGFIVKLPPSGSNLVFSTYYGGNREDVATGVAVDSAFNVYVTGRTSSAGLNMTGAFQPQIGGAQDAYVLKLNPSGSTIIQSSYLGGPNDELAVDIALDSSGNAYIFGQTSSSGGISTAGAYQAAYAGGNSDAFLAKMTFSADATSFTTSPAQISFQSVLNTNPAKQKVQITAPQGANPAWSVDVLMAPSGTWLTASPKNGSGLASIDVNVNTAGMPQPGSFSGTVVITNTATGVKTNIPVTLALTSPGGQITQNGIVNAGSFLAGPVSPGELVTLFGADIGPATLVGLQLTAAGLVSSNLSDTQVFFDGVAAPLIYVSATQVSAVVPYAVAGKSSTQVQVQYKGLRTNLVTVPVALSTPSVFTANSSGKGLVAALNQDGTFNTEQTPAPKETIVVLYATGAGRTDPDGADGKPANDVFPKPILPVSVKIGDRQADVLYAGAAPGFVSGVLQLNVKIPIDAPSGLLPVVVTIGSGVSQTGITIAVQ